MPRIQLKLMGAFAGVLVVIVAAVAGLAERGLRDREMLRIEQSLADRGHLVQELLGEPERGESVEALDALADAAGRAAGARVTLIARDGRVVGDSEVPLRLLEGLENHGRRPEVVEALAGRRGTHVRTSATVRRALLYVALPPSPGSEQPIVRLAVDLSDARAAIDELHRELIAASLIGLVVALIAGFALTRFLLRPVDELRETVTDLAAGRLEGRLDWDPRGDFGDIADAINRVASKLRTHADVESADWTRLDAVLDSMVEGVLVLDGDGRVSLANPRLQELLSVWSDPVGKSPIALTRNEVLHRTLRTAAESAEPQVCELELGPRTLLVHAVAVPPVGEGGCVAVFHDVSEIRKVDQMRRDFLANASHELRTPLTSIQGFATTLVDNEVTPEEARRFVEVIARNAERLKTLIDDLLELSQLEGRREPLRPTEVDIGHLARILLDDMKPRLEARALEASFENPGVPMTWGDRHAIEQVLTNLIDNAIKYSDEGGRIDVTLSDAGGRVEVSVADSGLGIPEDETDRIFERFYRVDKARSRALGGTGLGLAIVKHLLQAMGGGIRVESKLGEGSRFVFWLPTPPEDRSS